PRWAPQGKGITRDTNYLVIGDELPESRDPMNQPEPIQKTPLFQQARQRGVFVISLANYLEMIGYQPPRSLSDAPVARPPTVEAPKPEGAPPAPEKPKEAPA